MQFLKYKNRLVIKTNNSYVFLKVKNADDGKEIEWITVKGNHVPIKEGQDKGEAIKDFFEDKEKTSKNKIKYNISDVSGMFKSPVIKKHIKFELPTSVIDNVAASISGALFRHEMNNHYDEDILIPEEFNSTNDILDFIKSLDIKEEEEKARILESIEETIKNCDRYGEIASHFENPPVGNNIDSYGNKLSQETIDWFGNSKAVDKNNNPILLFHGGPKELKGGVFDLKHKSDSQNKQKAVFFNTRKDIAETYKNEDDGKLYKAYVKMEKPLIVDFQGTTFFSGGYKEFDVAPYGEEKTNINTTIIKRKSHFDDSSEAPVISKLVNYAKKNGYDGVIAKNIDDKKGYIKGYNFTDFSDDYIVFNPEKQIKIVKD